MLARPPMTDQPRTALVRRRAVLAAVAGASLATVAVGAGAAPAEAHGRSAAFDRPRSGFSSTRTVLRRESATKAGLDRRALDRAWRQVVAGTEPQPPKDPAATARPLYPGAVLAMGHDGALVHLTSTGWSRRYADGDGTDLPRSEWIATRTDTIYDMASVSKLFTSIVVMQQVEKGRIDLDAPVVRYLPEFARNGADGDGAESPKRRITIRHLLTHTSGFPSWLPLWRDWPDRESRIDAALTAKLSNAPGSTYLYSDLNLITLGELVGRLSGHPLDRLVAEGITRPLRMVDTGYNPPRSKLRRIAATEEQLTPARGVVWGEVHDENAWSLGGVAGHAGVFSTASDMALLAQALLNGGSHRGRRILAESSVEQMITDENTAFPGDAHGLGFELDQRWYMGALSGPRTAGHTGYTGTSLVIDFSSRSFVVLLSNRVHPSRNWGSVNPSRVAAAQGLAEALSVSPRRGRTSWTAGTANDTDATLRWDLTLPIAGTLDFDTFIDSEPDSDLLVLETSVDAGATWQPLDWTLDGAAITGPYAAAGSRTWQRGAAALPAGAVSVRFHYTSDASLSGRGVFVDGLEVRAGRRLLADAERHRGAALVADGWVEVSR